MPKDNLGIPPPPWEQNDIPAPPWEQQPQGLGDYLAQTASDLGSSIVGAAKGGIGALREFGGTLASGAAQMEGDVSFDVAQQLGEEIAAPGRSLRQLGEQQVSEAIQSSPIAGRAGALIGSLPVYANPITAGAASAGAARDQGLAAQLYQGTIGQAASMVLPPFARGLSSMPLRQAIPLGAGGALALGEATAAAQSFGPGGGGLEQFTEAQPYMPLAAGFGMLPGLAGAAARARASATMRSGIRQIPELRAERQRPHPGYIDTAAEPLPYPLDPDIVRMLAREGVEPEPRRMTPTDLEVAAQEEAFGADLKKRYPALPGPEWEVRTPAGATMRIPEMTARRMLLEQADVRQPTGSMMSRPAVTGARGEALARSLTEQATTPTAESMRQPVGFAQRPSELVSTPAGEGMTRPVGFQEPVDITTPTGATMRQPVGFDDAGFSVPAGESMIRPVRTIDAVDVRTPTGAAMQRPTLTTQPAEIQSFTGEGMRRPVRNVSDPAELVRQPSGETMRQSVGFREPIEQATTPTGKSMKGPQRLTEPELQTKIPRSAAMKEPVETPKRAIFEGDKVTIKGQGDTPVDVLNVDAETGAIQVRGRPEFVYPEDVQVVRRGTTQPELQPAREVPRAVTQEVTQQVTPEVDPTVRPTADTGPAPSPKAIPAEAPAAPAAPFKPGDTVNVLAPNGKVASKGMRVLGVNEEAGTVQVLNRSTGKPQEIPIARVEPVQKPVGELPAAAMAEKPVELGQQRNRARSGALGLGGGKWAKSLPEELFEKGVEYAGRGAKAVGRGAKAAVQKSTAAAAVLYRDARQKMKDAQFSSKVMEQVEGVEQEATAIRQLPGLLRAEQRSQLSVDAVPDWRRATRPVVPSKNFTGELHSPLQKVIEGNADINTLPKTLHNWVNAAWDMAKITADIAKTVPGAVFAQTPGGKVLIRTPGRDLIRMANQRGADWEAWVKTQASKPGAPDAATIKQAVADIISVTERGEGVISKTAMETFRSIKDMADNWAYNGKKMQILEIRPNTYVRSHVNNVARRLPFIRRFGDKYDPTKEINPLVGHPLLDKTLPDAVQQKQAAALQSWIRAVHGIGIGQKMATGVRKAVDVAGGNAIRVALKEGGEVVMPVYRGALLSGSQLLNTLGHAVASGTHATFNGHLVDWVKSYGKVFQQAERNRIKGVQDLPQHFYNFGDENVIRSVARGAGKALEFISRPFDRATAYHAAFYAESVAQKMSQKKMKGYRAELHKAEIEAMGYTPEMAEKMVSGQATPEQYRGYVDNFIKRFTGQTSSDVGKDALMRVSPFKGHLSFLSFANQQMRNLTQHLAMAAQDGRSMQTRIANLQKLAELTLGFGAGAAAAGLAWEFIRAGNVDRVKENTGAFLGETMMNAWGGTVVQAIAEDMSDGKPGFDTLARLSLPLGLTKKAADAAVKSFQSMSLDPIYQMAISTTPLANKGRDFLGWAAGLEAGAAPYQRRKAIAAFYKFSRDNPELMGSVMPEGMQYDVDPYLAAVRKVPKAKYGDKAALIRALQEAGEIGKTNKDVAEALRNRRFMPRFKAKTKYYGWAKLRDAIGPSAFRELMLNDMLLDAFADAID